MNLCCRSGGSNLNAGSRRGDTTEPGTSADLTYANGIWTSASLTFQVASGNPVTDGVTSGDLASVYVNGSTETGFIAVVTSVTSTTITLSTTQVAGTAPTSGSGTRTLKIGGAWAGPSGTGTFPFASLLTSPSAAIGGTNPAKVNFKNDQTYTMSVQLPFATAAQGYSTAYGDGGAAAISSSNTTTRLVNGNGALTADFTITNTAATGTANGFTIGTTGAIARRITVVSARGSGFTSEIGAAGVQYIECQAYDCNKSNTSGLGGFTDTSGTKYPLTLVRCMSYGHSGSNGDGYRLGSGSTAKNCAAFSNGGKGFVALAGSATLATILNCDSYSNTGSGLYVSTSGNVYAENCNFVKNGGYGVELQSSSTATTAFLVNCGFGSGTQANTSGATSTSIGLQTEGSVTYASGVTPWTDPANGDFRIALAAAQGTGRGSFTETQNSMSGTVGYPDIGAAQHLAAAAGGFIIGS